MRTTVRWLLVVGAVLATLPAGAATWYVATTGDDANTGDSPSAAFKTIRRGWLTAVGAMATGAMTWAAAARLLALAAPGAGGRGLAR